jgi:hypothetical protein
MERVVAGPERKGQIISAHEREVVAAVILTLIIGFNWGGWVTGGTAKTLAKDAVVQRLSSICVSQYQQDPGKVAKLGELNEVSTYRIDDYVTDQGWATMPGDEEPDRNVADACAKLLVQVNQ